MPPLNPTYALRKDKSAGKHCANGTRDSGTLKSNTARLFVVINFYER